ncbi:MAG: hypothetical protein AAF289_10110 [Cyanobacteria bacterium P01_A01_bin.135]
MGLLFFVAIAGGRACGGWGWYLGAWPPSPLAGGRDASPCNPLHRGGVLGVGVLGYVLVVSGRAGTARPTTPIGDRQLHAAIAPNSKPTLNRTQTEKRNGTRLCGGGLGDAPVPPEGVWGLAPKHHTQLSRTRPSTE